MIVLAVVKQNAKAKRRMRGVLDLGAILTKMDTRTNAQKPPRLGNQGIGTRKDAGKN
jgi:hypothetical protein